MKRMSLPAKVTAMVVISLLCLAVALVATVVWSLETNARNQAFERQESNMRVAWDVINQYGRTHVVRDGALYADRVRLNDFNEPVDRIKELVEGTATIFMNDTRVTTNVMKEDGTRAVGTKLAPGPVYDAVLVRGEPYRGEADILGKSYYTAYDPILDVTGQPIGVLYVGIEQQVFMAPVYALELKLVAISLGILALFIGASLYLSRRMFAPLYSLTGVIRRLASGETHIAVPETGRRDDIGEMARSVATLKEAALKRIEAEASAADARATTETERRSASERQNGLMSEQNHVVDEIGRGLDRLANGDLTTRIETAFPDGYEKLRSDFNRALDALDGAMATIAQSGDQIHSGINEIRGSSDDLARRTEQQAASLEETSAALGEINGAVKRTADGADSARDLAGKAKKRAEGSAQVVGQAVDAMTGIEASSRQISQIISVIDEIAFQTNLLALNAGVEAARAGEAGRGFAVVAQEVRALAQRSAEAAKEIKTLINTSTTQVDQGVELVGRTGTALSEILGDIIEMNTVILQISELSRNQASGIGEISSAVTNMDHVTQQNAAMVEEATAAAHRLGEEADRMAGLIGRFSITGAAASSPSTKRPPERSRSNVSAASGERNAKVPARPVRMALAGNTALKIEPSDQHWDEF